MMCNFKFTIIIVLFLFTGCGLPCNEFIKEQKPLAIDLKLSKPVEIVEHQFILYGTIKSGIEKKTRIEPFWYLPDNCQIGDSIKKRKGDTNIYIIRGDTIICLQMYCDGEIYTEPINDSTKVFKYGFGY